MKKGNALKTTTSLALTRNKSSCSITKSNPKVRVVHIPVPDIIEIEPEDFQKLVQQLTGKSTETTNIELKKPDEPEKTETKTLNGFLSYEWGYGSGTTGEEENYSSESSSDAAEFGFDLDLDQFINELIDFPILSKE